MLFRGNELRMVGLWCWHEIGFQISSSEAHRRNEMGRNLDVK